MTARQVSNRSGRNMIGRFPSLKLERMVSYESLIEQDYIYLLEYLPQIESYQEQPVTIHYKVGRKSYRYTPDFQVVEAGQPRLVECKPAERVNTPQNQRKFLAAQQWCQSRNWRFQVVTEKAIRAGHLLKNVKDLWRHAHHPVSPIVEGQIYAALHRYRRPLPIAMLAQAVDEADTSAIVRTILTLLFRHNLYVSMESRLSAQSVVSFPKYIPPKRRIPS
ncbi:TnsA endonuclease N-terminal domain-containing protein [Anaerolineales bacterium HSG6]|nr:TnsA endonuclease N-terminal domain-containing protein [Anaerolineales bacterium HSG6]